ncbi:NAD-dependent epimerase/dehydratase family protein [Nocardia aurea]|uniref:NAD-dependent epimerase/dehydratase family protein n=1 Tax=Nocardia aurea TaxID=2144174 RepID=A0ABV3FXT0_9NOCA
MKVLVTGATGFLGSHIVEAALAAGDEVRVLTRPGSDKSYLRTLPGVEIFHGDLGDPDSLLSACRGVEVVHHSAGRVEETGRRAQFWDANVVGTRNLLDAARAEGVDRMVYVSSPSVATDYVGDRFGIDESEPYVREPKSLYVETKAIAEQEVLAANGPDLLTCALRPRMIWGPRSGGWMSLLLRKIRSGRLPDLSGGRPVMVSMTYCEHAAAASVRASRSDRVAGNAYFLADAEDVDLWRFARDLATALDLTPPTRTVPAPVLKAAVTAFDTLWRLPGLAERVSPPLSSWTVAALTVSSTYDTTAARRDFGYSPSVSREEGLLRYVEWVRSVGGVPAVVG